MEIDFGIDIKHVEKDGKPVILIKDYYNEKLCVSKGKLYDVLSEFADGHITAKEFLNAIDIADDRYSITNTHRYLGLENYIYFNKPTVSQATVLFDKLIVDNNNGPYFYNDILNFKFYSEDTDYKNGYSAFKISPSFRIECRDDFAPERNKNHNATLYICEEAPLVKNLCITLMYATINFSISTGETGITINSTEISFCKDTAQE